MKEYFSSKDLKLIYNISNYLMKQLKDKFENDSKNCIFKDYIMYQISANINAIICDYYYGDRRLSSNMILIYRSLYEEFALLNMFDEGKIDADEVELFKINSDIIEFNNYRNHKDFYKKNSFNIKKIIEKYDNAYKKYLTVFKDDDKVKEQLKRKIPWLKYNYSYELIVETYLPQVTSMYKSFSFMFHPHDVFTSQFVSLRMDVKETLGFVCSRFYMILKSYPTKNLFDDNFSYNYDANEIYYKDENYIYLSLNYYECKNIFEFNPIHIKTNLPHDFSQYFFEYCNFIKSLSLDYIYNYNEISICRFKSFIELAALHYRNICLGYEENYDDMFRLLFIYSNAEFLVANGRDPEKYKKQNLEAYELYCKYIKEVSFDEFMISFYKSLGFIGKNISIRSFVYDFIDSLDDKNNSELCKYFYDLSQSVSHCNGYTITLSKFINNKIIYKLFDDIIIFLCEKYIDLMEYFVYNKGNKKVKQHLMYIKKDLENIKLYCDLKRYSKEELLKLNIRVSEDELLRPTLSYGGTFNGM